MSKNYNLLNIIDKIEQRKANITQSIIPIPLMRNQINPSLKLDIIKFEQIKEHEILPNLKTKQILNEDKKEINKDNFKFDFDNGQKCPKHNLTIHSYAIGTDILLCDKCISETQKKAYPLPGVLKEIKRKINENSINACLIKNEIERIENFFEEYLEEFRKTNYDKIEKVFNYFYKIIDYFHNNANQLLKQCIKQQENLISNYRKELQSLNEKVSGIENELIEMSQKEEKEIFGSIERLKTIQIDLHNFINYNLELDLFSMNIRLNTEEKENLFKSIEKAYNLQVEFLKIENQHPSINKILSKGKYWQCICGSLFNNFSEVKCTSCDFLYRKIETIPNFLNQPENVSNNDIKIYK